MSGTMMKQRILVTGGGKGIGAEIVRCLAAEGYDVDLTSRASFEAAGHLADELTAAYPQQTFRLHAADLADRDDVERLAAVVMRFEGLYGFVHNAGMSYDSLAATINQERAMTLMQVNFWSMTRIAAAALRPMVRARRGRIVAIGSVTSLRGTQGTAAYAASKGALASYMRTLAVEVAARGITANTILPGFVDTQMLAPYRAHREELWKRIPAGRFARAEEVAGLVRYLLSPEAAYITGAEIAIDGGLTAVTPVRHA